MRKIFALLLALILSPVIAFSISTQTDQTKQAVSEVSAVNEAAPEVSDAIASEEIQQTGLTRGEYDYNPASPRPGRDIFPKIEDKVRLKSILELIGKIYRGEQLPYSQDGVVFKNREGILPAQPYGFYHEYTLLPPGDYPSHVVIGGVSYALSEKLGKRGAERIIIGGGQLVYYTPDHYRTFIQLHMVY